MSEQQQEEQKSDEEQEKELHPGQNSENEAEHGADTPQNVPPVEIEDPTKRPKEPGKPEGETSETPA